MRSVGLTLDSGIEHERATVPLKCTEQAPHCATPQPYFVPVRPTCSRITHRSGVSASTLTSRVLPLMLSFAMAPPMRDHVHDDFALPALNEMLRRSKIARNHGESRPPAR